MSEGVVAAGLLLGCSAAVLCEVILLVTYNRWYFTVGPRSARFRSQHGGLSIPDILVNLRGKPSLEVDYRCTGGKILLRLRTRPLEFWLGWSSFSERAVIEVARGAPTLVARVPLFPWFALTAFFTASFATWPWMIKSLFHVAMCSGIFGFMALRQFWWLRRRWREVALIAFDSAKG